MEMRPLIWTTEKPTKSGWYWWRHNSHVEPDMLKVVILGEKFVVRVRICSTCLLANGPDRCAHRHRLTLSHFLPQLLHFQLTPA